MVFGGNCDCCAFQRSDEVPQNGEWNGGTNEVHGRTERSIFEEIALGEEALPGHLEGSAKMDQPDPAHQKETGELGSVTNHCACSTLSRTPTVSLKNDRSALQHRI
jgi:hypothetical protein